MGKRAQENRKRLCFTLRLPKETVEWLRVFVKDNQLPAGHMFEWFILNVLQTDEMNILHEMIHDLRGDNVNVIYNEELRTAMTTGASADTIAPLVTAAIEETLSKRRK
jgi:hypothetical protein